MNTIIMYEKDLDKLQGYVNNHYFENFIFNEFKLILYHSGIKGLYKIRNNGKNTEVDYRLIKGSTYKDCKFIFTDCEEGIELIEKPNGYLIDFVQKKYSNLPYHLAEKDTTTYAEDFGEEQAKLIATLKQYIMNESYNRKVIQKEGCARNSTKTNKPKKVISNRKTSPQFLLGDVIEYVSGNGRRHGMACECWEVRGHFRHYKSGKVVWISGYEKGKARNTIRI